LRTQGRKLLANSMVSFFLAESFVDEAETLAIGIDVAETLAIGVQGYS
jgi:hypothetical protein